MDDTVLKVAIAAFIHDIGKFAEHGLDVTADYLNRNAGLYQPFYNGRHTHRHAVYTAAFVEQIEKLLPKQLTRANWGLNDSFINLTAGHHNPETPMQWIIAMADRISSGWDRDNFEKEYNRAIAWRDYKKTRLLPLFEALLREDRQATGDYKYRYPLKEINPSSIFPFSKSETEPQTNETAAEEYKDLFDGFIVSLERLLHREENIELWFEHFERLMLIFTSSIPAARAGNVVPDVSLYDHAKSTAALATALYRYHADTDTLTIDGVKDDRPRKFLLVGGDFYGIQNFIFSDSGEAGKRRSKILRGRSFMVSLFTDLAADMLCREIGIPSSSILLNAAGKFTLIAPNTDEVQKAIQTVESKINKWLIDMTCGENALGISTVEAAPSDFVSGRFIQLYESLAERMAERKFRKYDLDLHGGTVQGFLDRFDNTLQPPLCPYCGKRPSSREAEQFRERNDKSYCAVCRDHIFLGEHIVKETRIAICTKEADIKGPGSKLLEPIFGTYQVAFIEGGLSQLARDGSLLKYWDIGINETGQAAKDVTARFINGSVPVYLEEDLHDDRILEGRKNEARTLELIEQIRVDRERITPKTFSHIAAKALNPDSEVRGCYRGIRALGVLKADVDQLGMLMSCGLPQRDITLSRIASLSRQMNFFFAVYLPHLLKTDTRFNNVYTVFAGGDDLFLIGPWNRVIELAAFLRDRFVQYTCQNPELHLSAGISIQKDHTPLGKMAKDAEAALEHSKTGNPDKGKRGDCITLFGETATWDEYTKLLDIAESIEAWRDNGIINNAMLYRMNSLMEMASRADALVKDKNVEIGVEDMECLKWRAMFRYTTERNIGKNIKNEEERKVLQRDFGKAAQWLEDHGGKLKVALWNVIYNNR